MKINKARIKKLGGKFFQLELLKRERVELIKKINIEKKKSQVNHHENC